MFKRVFYVIVAVFFGVAIYYINLASDQTAYKLDIVKNAIENEEYETIPRLFGGLFDSETIVNDETDHFELRVYPGTERQIIEYEDDKHNEIKYENFENAYYFYMFNADFDMSNVTTEKGTVNATAFRFYSNENKFDYNLIMSKSVNKDKLVEFPNNISEGVLKGFRNLIDTNDEFNIIHQSFTETMIEEIEKVLGGDIDHYALVDNQGKEIYKQAINLEFEDAFFLDVASMVEKTDNFFKDYDNETDKKKKNDIVNEYESFYNNWVNDFKKSGHDKYLFRFTNAELKPAELRFKSIWPLIGYIFGALLLYICLFYRKAITALGRKIFTKKDKEDKNSKNTSKKEVKVIESSKNEKKR